jgi:WD40 repeat protein
VVAPQDSDVHRIRHDARFSIRGIEEQPSGTIATIKTNGGLVIWDDSGTKLWGNDGDHTADSNSQPAWSLLRLSKGAFSVGDGIAKYWDFADEQNPVWSIGNDELTVKEIRELDSQKVAIVCKEKLLVVSLADGGELNQFEGSTDADWVGTSDDRAVAAFIANGELIVFATQDNSITKRFAVESVPTKGFFLKQNSMLVVISQDAEICLLDLESEGMESISIEPLNQCTDASISPDGKWVALLNDDYVTLVELHSRRILGLFERLNCGRMSENIRSNTKNNDIANTCFSTDSRRFIIQSGLRSIEKIELESGFNDQEFGTGIGSLQGIANNLPSRYRLRLAEEFVSIYDIYSRTDIGWYPIASREGLVLKCGTIAAFVELVSNKFHLIKIHDGE